MKNFVRIMLGCGILFFTSCKKNETVENDVEKELQEVAANLNQMGAMEMGEGVRLDKTEVEPTKTLHYYYTFTEDDADSLTAEQIEEFKTMLKQEAISSVKTTEDLSTFKENDVTLKYSYKDKNGKQLLDFAIQPSDYK